MVVVIVNFILNLCRVFRLIVKGKVFLGNGRKGR